MTSTGQEPWVAEHLALYSVLLPLSWRWVPQSVSPSWLAAPARTDS